MDNYIDEVIQELENRKFNAENGIINGIPFAIESIRDIIPSTERGSYILYTGQSKSGKTQSSYYQQLFHNVLYHYNHPNEFNLHIIMFPLEEGKKKTVCRFMSFLLYKFYGVRISYTNLLSSNKKYPLDGRILALIKGSIIKPILDHFKDVVQFESANNPIGICKIIEDYADSHGKMIYKDTTFIDKNGVERRNIDHYEPKNKDDYVFVFLDHFNLIEPTKNDNNDKGTAISNLSNQFVKFYRNYNYIIVAVQQQVDSETSSLDAIKNNNILPTKAGLKDSKTPGQDQECYIYMYFYSLLVKIFGYVNDYSYICNKLYLM